MAAIDMARYFDGQTAIPHHLKLVAQTPVLTGIDADGAILLRWPWDQISILAPEQKGLPAILGSTTSPAARLHLSAADFIAIKDYLPQPSLISRIHDKAWRWAAILTAVIALIVTAVYMAAPPIAVIAADYVPERWVRSLGLELRAILLADHDICTEATGIAAMDKIIASFSSNLDPAPKITAMIVQEKNVNAFVLPGGLIVINSGLITYAGDADEVAGVVAHEIGHIIERHSTRNLIRIAGWSLVFLPLFRDLNTATLTALLLSLNYSVDQEREADRVGVALILGADGDPHGLKDMFARILADEGKAPEFFSYFATHPPLSERIAAIDQKAQPESPQSPLSEAEWSALRSVCNVTKPAPLPSAKWFHH